MLRSGRLCTVKRHTLFGASLLLDILKEACRMKTHSVYPERRTNPLSSSPPADPADMERSGGSAATADLTTVLPRRGRLRALGTALFGAVPAVVVGLGALVVWQLIVQLQL